MPLIAYQGAHGSNDFPLHFSFFSYLEREGILDRFDFAIDTWHDKNYALMLLHRFPQLKLVEDYSGPRRALLSWYRAVGRGYRPLSFLDSKFDGVCQAPGGYINERYCRQDIFRLYPRIRRRAILFHSIESGALQRMEVRRSVASCDLVVARTPQSAKNARQAGAPHVVESADVAFLEHPRRTQSRPGIAVALRLPTRDPGQEYLGRLREIVGKLCKLEGDVDFVLPEEPFGAEMTLAGIGSYAQPGTGLYYNDAMYLPFLRRREAVVSSRLHTTIVALLYGNRKILQYHIELGTNKIEEIIDEAGLHSLKVHRVGDVTWERVSEFLNSPETIPESEALTALERSKAKAVIGMQAIFEWLHSLK